MPELPAVPKTWTVLSMLDWATGYFESKSINQPRLSIEWLLADALACKRLDLYLQFDRLLHTKELSTLKPAILRRAAHEPLQYITGKTDFFGLEMKVGPEVLIPRPETEQLVELILEDAAQESELCILDAGTGSGCIAIALKTERPDFLLSAFDISRQALETARINAEKHKAQIRFFEHDLFRPDLTGGAGPYHIIVSNPPYIPFSERASIDREVAAFEPETALFHHDVSSVYAALARFGRKNLRPGGTLYAEIHENLGPEISREIAGYGFQVQIRQDYAGKDRMLACKIL
ncbi:MAG: peptide chain release factor N(5)-glutamine methyltransferase [Candidatus Cyclonatronum sp.]|uniref:peptide chain release factor N(5)-glutamine methyltransferase n=1 Tax=Cyclonatronum sp. TaxID=3024185 RepID=UPI0025C4E514|nr:peptide chain release factor N(5)-glutamine methyltransferase [Cyclonatronum sp.]MCC5934602.1 peptide chain release factor N(5)-glutamine methyltransferase [Balneolales bacterium]MCH8485501.1 peptide chain release factor N(5)-glutamine methyltransferase [Cyclonatronum sp.]